MGPVASLRCALITRSSGRERSRAAFRNSKRSNYSSATASPPVARSGIRTPHDHIARLLESHFARGGGGVTLLRPRPRSIIIIRNQLVFTGGEREQRHFHSASPSQVDGRRGHDRSACRAHILPPRLARPGRTRV